MEFEKKYLPLEKAVKAAVLQNIKTDLRTGAISSTPCSDEQELYKLVARDILIRTGENFPPDPNLVVWWERKPKHICLKGWKNPSMATAS